MEDRRQLTVLCIATFEKGQAFIRQAKREGCRVILLTVEKHRNANWPRESIDETFYLPENWTRDDVIKGVSYLCRHQVIDRIAPLDEFDQETAAILREHLRIPGMGDTTARYFRDKLAMRMKARSGGILVPDFAHVLNYDRVKEFMSRVPGPWVLKPRSEAASIGIKKVRHADELWPLLDALGDRQSFYVLERYVGGDIFHVDSIVADRQVVFAVPHKYGTPPMDVSLGGIFTTRKIPRSSEEARTLLDLNSKVVNALGLVRGVTHTEFIRGHEDGQFYFLETAARVGGANIAEAVEAATGLNLWAEWARVEIAGEDFKYELPEHRDDYSGVIISLAKQEKPDLSAYVDPEIGFRLNKPYHAGLVVASSDPERVRELLESYTTRFYNDFYATAPPLETANQ